MRRYSAALLVLALSAMSTRDAAAQPSEKDITAYFALNNTHVGALNPMMAPVTDRSGFNSFAVRIARHAPEVDGGEANNILGASGFFKAGQNAVVSATLGYNMVGCPTGAECDNGLMLGGDIQSSIWKSAGNTPTSMNASRSTSGRRSRCPRSSRR